ncbi:MAG: AAA family ATPase [Desulfovibrio sp.]|nr:AAA family ATPase [Desulfovibrio sp.]
MLPIIATGKQSFSDIRNENCFYIDKTRFIRDWWNSNDDVTLITRPRRFGKTLMLDTVNTFFSVEFSNSSKLFEGLEIWEDKKFRMLQGTIPVISLSFADIKENTYQDAIASIKELLKILFRHFSYQLDTLLDWEKELFSTMDKEISEQAIKRSLRNLSECLTLHFKNKPIILLDEYDTPLQEAWINNYWDKLVNFMRGFFNSTFKANPYLGRGLISGLNP